jgi:predicted metal-dependent enzyme (double-stranded beta helix superfamily)
MFDLDVFVTDCTAARRETEPRLAIKEVLTRAVSDPAALAAVLPPERAGLVRLHASPELTVLNVVWAPGMSFGPHDHHMFAAIGIYIGGEDNTFYRRGETSLVETGSRSLGPKDVCLLGDDAVHAVANRTENFTGAIHVYGGDFFTTPRSEWRGDPLHEEVYDVARAIASFDAANATRP